MVLGSRRSRGWPRRPSGRLRGGGARPYWWRLCSGVPIWLRAAWLRCGWCGLRAAREPVPCPSWYGGSADGCEMAAWVGEMAAAWLRGGWRRARPGSGVGIRVGGAGWATVWRGCCSGRGRRRREVRRMDGELLVERPLHGVSVAQLAATAGFYSGVGASVGGPFRPSLHFLVVQALLPSKGWSSPSCGPPLVPRPVLQDRTRLAHDAAGPSLSRARCSRTDLVPLSVLQDRDRLAHGAAGRVGGCQLWPAYWVSTLGVAQGCERWDLSARSFHWGAAGLE